MYKYRWLHSFDDIDRSKMLTSHSVDKLNSWIMSAAHDGVDITISHGFRAGSTSCDMLTCNVIERVSNLRDEAVRRRAELIWWQTRDFENHQKRIEAREAMAAYEDQWSQQAQRMLIELDLRTNQAMALPEQKEVRRKGGADQIAATQPKSQHIRFAGRFGTPRGRQLEPARALGFRRGRGHGRR